MHSGTPLWRDSELMSVTTEKRMIYTLTHVTHTANEPVNHLQFSNFSKLSTPLNDKECHNRCIFFNVKPTTEMVKLKCFNVEVVQGF